MAMAMPAMEMADDMDRGGANGVAEVPKEEPKEAGTSTSTDTSNLANLDFMSYEAIKKNTREYSHKLRQDFDKFNRIDFTQTLLFFSAK